MNQQPLITPNHIHKVMDGKSDAWNQRQLRSTSTLKGMKSNILKKCPNKGRNNIKGKSGHLSSSKSKPAFEYNLANFPQLGETNSLSNIVKEKSKNNRGSKNSSTQLYDYNEIKKENQEVLRSNILHERCNIMVSEDTQDNTGFEVYKPKGAKKRNSSVSSDYAKYNSGRRRERHSSVSSDRVRHSSVSSDTSYASRLSFSADVPDNWESRDSTASPGDFKPKDIKLPLRRNDKSSEYIQENVSQKMLSTQVLPDYMDIELPYKPKPIKLTEKEMESLKYIRPMTYRLCNKNTESNSSIEEFKSRNEKKVKHSSTIMNDAKKSSGKKLPNRTMQDVIHPLNFEYKKSSDKHSSHSHKIGKNNIMEKVVINKEKIGNDFLNQRSFLVNHQTKYLEDSSKNRRRMNSGIGQSGCLQPSYHSWHPDTFCRPNEAPQKVHNSDWRGKTCSPTSRLLEEEDYYYGNIPYEMDPFGSDCENSPRSAMSPHDAFSSSRSSSFDAATPTSLTDMFNLHSGSPCSWDVNKTCSPIPYQIPNGYLGTHPYNGKAYNEGSPAINSALLPQTMNMFTQFQIPDVYLLPGFESSSQLLDSSLSFATHKNLSLNENSLMSFKNISNQHNEKSIWFDPILEKENIWA